MIQRIQTIWLLVASALGFTSLQTSFYSGHRINDAIPKPVVFLTASYNPLLIVSTVTAAVIALITIFLYKDRKLQMKLTIAALVLSIITLGLYYWQIQSFVPAESSITLTAVVPVAIPVLLILAFRGIWKDEKLVKSVDRLR